MSQEYTTDLLFEILKIVQPEIYKLQRGQAQPHVYPRDISKIKIPVPNKDQQKLIKKELVKLSNDRGKFLAQGIAVQDLEKVLQDEKKKIIVKHCFKSK